MTADVDDFIQHAGVKGMKWGVRKTADSFGRAHKMANQAKEAFAIKNPEQQAAYDGFKKKVQVTTAVVGVGYLAAPYVRKYGDVAVRALGSAALKVAADRGARQAAASMLSLGAKPVISLIQDSNGVWR